MSIFLLCSAAHAEVFERLSVEQGLSTRYTHAILQDHDGFMWIGTDNGLNRFDGYSCSLYKYDDRDTQSLSSNTVFGLFEDRSGTLWIGTNDGFNKFDPSHHVFARYKPGGGAVASPANVINAITQDSSGMLWIGTEGGLFSMDIATGRFTSYAPDQGSRGIRPLSIWFLHVSKKGILWIGTHVDGVWCINPQTGSMKEFSPQSQPETGFRGFVITAIAEDAKGTLWFSTQGGGLNSIEDPGTGSATNYRFEGRTDVRVASDWINGLAVDKNGTVWCATLAGLLGRLDRTTGRFDTTSNPTYDPKRFQTGLYADRNGNIWIMSDNGLDRFDPATKSYTHFHHDPNDRTSISDNGPIRMMEDRAGSLWIATRNGGVSRMDPSRKPFRHVARDPEDQRSLIDNYVLSFCEDIDGSMWVGTRSGLCRFDPHTWRGKRYLHREHDRRSLNSDRVRCMTLDHDGTLWLGTVDGMARYNRATDDFMQIHPCYDDTKETDTLRQGWIEAMTEDRRGDFWIGASAGGINKLDRKTGKFKWYPFEDADSASPSTKDVRVIAAGEDSTLWIGGAGLSHFDPRSGTVRRFRHAATDTTTISSDVIRSICVDHAGEVWVGTFQGLNHYDARSTGFNRYYEKDGLSDDRINSIIEDTRGNLWISTGSGITRIDANRTTIRTYGPGDGLQEREFIAKAAMRAHNGDIYFGGFTGFEVFSPDSIHDNAAPPPVLITGLRIFNRDVVFDRVLWDMKQVEVKYNENMISLDFVALNYAGVSGTKYSYRLDGFDHDWVQCGTQRFAPYTNLDPGEYLFHVKAANTDGAASAHDTTLKIIVHPPWWLTTWFRVSAVALLIGLLYGGYRFRIRTIEQQKHLLEVQVEERTADLQAERAKSEQLLLNILPVEIADRLKAGDTVIADHYDAVTIIFADIVNFTALSSRVSPKQVVEILNIVFTAFDALSEEFGLEKIKTIGDAYMAVAGLPTPRADHAQAAARMALAMQEAVRRIGKIDGEEVALRIGINSGPVVCGVIGSKKFAYDLWSDTVNTASRMESNSVPGRIQVTEATYELLRNDFTFEPRGEIDVKGKGMMQAYFLTGSV